MSLSLEELVLKLIALVEEGRFLEAIERFYTEDAIMQDNDDAPRVGMASILAGERVALSHFKEIHTSRAESFLVDGNRVAINWIFEFTDPQGCRRRLNEIAYQQWRDGRIVQERFYYDPAQRRVEITAEGWPFERFESRAVLVA
jgi:hypothetical protein